MTQITIRLYVGVFILLVLSLGVWSVQTGRSFRVSDPGDVIHGALAQQYERYYNDSFPVKDFGAGFWAAVQYLLFQEGRKGVVIGEQGWLYTQEEFIPYPDFSQRVTDQLSHIVAVRDYLRRRDVELVLALLPAKARVYPEFRGDRKPDVTQETLYVSALQSLTSQQVIAPTLLPVLRQQKAHTPVFLRTDTHWTPMGAEAVAAGLAKALKPQFPALGWGETRFQTDVQAPIDHRGDLMNFLPLAPYFEHLGPQKEIVQARVTRTDAAVEDNDLFAEVDIPVALVGTSYSANALWNFAGALEQVLGVAVANYAQAGKGPMIPMMEYLLSDDFEQVPPQLIIWEIPERYLPFEYDLTPYALPFLTSSLKDSEG
ncbi:MAG: alginate O-acetyltransferase [Gammaproteobacteria bacterium]